MSGPHEYPHQSIEMELARSWLKQHAAKKGGAICPCCKRFDKVYSRKINQGAIRQLAKLKTLNDIKPYEFWHYSKISASQSDFPKFALLQLIQRQPTTHRDNKKTSGYYRITDKGRKFLAGVMTIPERIVMYHGEMIATSTEQKSVHDIWPEFNYHELMRETNNVTVLKYRWAD